jgi:hypothetical protein
MNGGQLLWLIARGVNNRCSGEIYAWLISLLDGDRNRDYRQSPSRPQT